MKTDATAFLRALFDIAVATADPMRVVRAHLPDRPAGRLIVIGAGKASARMAEAVEAHYGPCKGLVITRYGHARPCAGIEIVEAAHPVPDAAGAAATDRMLQMISKLSPDDLVLALFSGGGSSLLCAPAFGMTLAEKQAVNSALLASGAPISEMNLLRKHLSLVKGGQLAARAHPARVVTLMISDVPGNDPASIASGPTVGDDSTSADALAVARRWNIQLPENAILGLSAGSGVVSTASALLERAQTHIIAAPSHSLSAAAAHARSHHCDVRLLGDSLEGEARQIGIEHARLALSIQAGLQKGAQPVLLLSGGELTVTRRGAGIGGPNAEFALAAFTRLQGAPGIHLLACDTDGIDGAAEVAGAFVTPATQALANACQLDATAMLDANDSHSFFAAVGQQVITGPTLTNVNDFRAILIEPPVG